MAISNYPNGFGGSGVAIRGVSILLTHPGKAYWVSNNTTGLLASQRGGSDGNHGTFDSPFATLNYALTQCVANRGDIILIKPGHAETVSSATALNFSMAGVAIVGLGYGSSRPKFTLDTANTSTIPVTADNISIQNCQFVGNFLSIAACFTIASAKNFTIQSCTFADTSGVLNFLNVVKTTGTANTADGLAILDSNWNSLGTTSVNSFVLTANTIDSLTLLRNNVKLVRTAVAAILCTVTAGILTNADVGFNKGVSAQTTTTGGSLISVGGTTSNGWVYDNFVQTLTTTTDLLFTTTVGLSAFDNRVTGVIGASGFLIPTADS